MAQWVGENDSHCYTRNPSFLVCISPPQGEQGCHRPEGTGWSCSGISSTRRVSGTGNPMAVPEPETLPPTFCSIPPFPPLLPSPYKDSVALSGAAVSARPPLGFRRNTINNSENLKNSHKGEGPGWCFQAPGQEAPSPHGCRSGAGGSVELVLHLVQDSDDNVPQRLRQRGDTVRWSVEE